MSSVSDFPRHTTFDLTQSFVQLSNKFVLYIQRGTIVSTDDEDDDDDDLGDLLAIIPAFARISA